MDISMGRDLTENEKEKISSWSKSRQETFRLTKKYGSVANIPQDDLQSIKTLLQTENQVKIEEVVKTQEEKTKEDGSPVTNTEISLLFEAYPPTNWMNKTRDLQLLSDNIKTKSDYDKFLSLFMAYGSYLKQTQTSKAERLKYTSSIKKFLNDHDLHYKLERIGTVKEVNQTIVPRQEQRIQRRWDLPLRPLYPWEKDTTLKFTSEEKRTIIEKLKEETGFNDKNNDTWWFSTP